MRERVDAKVAAADAGSGRRLEELPDDRRRKLSAVGIGARAAVEMEDVKWHVVSL
jgi:hypothetical protein